jgi:hypothetical protein
VSQGLLSSVERSPRSLPSQCATNSSRTVHRPHTRLDKSSDTKWCNLIRSLPFRFECANPAGNSIITFSMCVTFQPFRSANSRSTSSTLFISFASAHEFLRCPWKTPEFALPASWSPTRNRDAPGGSPWSSFCFAKDALEPPTFAAVDILFSILYFSSFWFCFKFLLHQIRPVVS